MKKTIGGLPVFAVMVLVLVGVLQLANWIPSAVQEGALQRYASIEEVRSRIATAIYMPVYYPPGVRWPPSLIAAQKRPYPAVVTEFRRSDADDTVLTITQTALREQPLRERIVLASVRERVSYSFKGRTAVLEVGLCKTGERCSRITWDEDGFTLVLAYKDTPVDLVRIAESMIVTPEKEKLQHSATPGDGRTRQ